SYSAANLPNGLTVNTTTGLISGKATAAGTSKATVGAKNASGTGTAVLTIDMQDALLLPVITSPLTASGTVGTPFQYQITGTNNPRVFSIVGSPSWLTVDITTGVITGTPTAAGTFSFTIGASNEDGKDNKTLVLTVTSGSPTPKAPAITSSLAASGTVSQ